MMSVNNVNYYALEKVLEAAKRFQKISEWMGHSPLDDEGLTLDSCIFMIGQNLKVGEMMTEYDGWHQPIKPKGGNDETNARQ
jgi:hypothetical protein